MKNYKINGTTLFINDFGGEGLTVLFLHGFPFDHSIWSHVCSRGIPGFRLIAPDLRGLGRSELPDGAGPTTMELFADDLHALLEAMGVTEKIVVVGLSMGGYVAMQFAGKYPDRLASVVLCNTKTTADPPTVAENRRIQAENLRTKTNFLKTVADTMIPKLFAAKTQAERPEVVEKLRSIIESNNPLGAAAATLGMAQRSDTTELLRQIDVPVLVVCGSEDQFSPPKEMRPLAGFAKRGRYVEIADAGHLPVLERPEKFTETLVGFLGELVQ